MKVLKPKFVRKKTAWLYGLEYLWGSKAPSYIFEYSEARPKTPEALEIKLMLIQKMREDISNDIDKFLLRELGV